MANSGMGVIDRLKGKILVDGFHVVVDLDKSEGSWIVDKETGRRYLDCYSQFASQPLGWNHPSLVALRDKIAAVALHKIANSDMYSEPYADFVEEFASFCPDFEHFFFVEGGALAVENALKAAFDWKSRTTKSFQSDNSLVVAHLADAFHGRSGYTMSLTNTDANKIERFPKFGWLRLQNPRIINQPDWDDVADSWESGTIDALEDALKSGWVSAFIMETIQGEGGDNHYRPEFFRKVRELVDRYEAMFIIDEVQTGLGLTGKTWAYEHFGVVPDMMCFGKKTQVCGFCSTGKIDSVPDNVFRKSGRINSTWGGNLVDMVRATGILKIIRDEKLVENAAEVGEHLLNGLKAIDSDRLYNVRGRGLMIAFDCKSRTERDELVSKLQEDMMVLKSGHRSIRFRPVLTFSKADADLAVEFVRKALS